jgi:hypothetical protein
MPDTERGQYQAILTITKDGLTAETSLRSIHTWSVMAIPVHTSEEEGNYKIKLPFRRDTSVEITKGGILGPKKKLVVKTGVKGMQINTT